MIVNLFLGWTLVGWVAALAWACTKSESQRVSGNAPIKSLPIPQPLTTPPTDTVERLERLAKLKEQGILTEEEFHAQKAIILPSAHPVPPPMAESQTLAIAPLFTGAVEQIGTGAESLSDGTSQQPESGPLTAKKGGLVVLLLVVPTIIGAIIVLAVALQSKSVVPNLASSETVQGISTPASTIRLTDEEIRKQNEIALAALRSKESPTAQATPETESTPVPTASEYLRTEAWPGRDFQVTKRTWEKGGFDAVAIWHVTIKNLTNRPIGNFSYTAIYQSETGVDHGSKSGQLEKRLEPGEMRTFEINDGFIDTQSDRASIGLTEAEFLGLPEPTPRKGH
jgi:hypothetical protein